MKYSRSHSRNSTMSDSREMEDSPPRIHMIDVVKVLEYHISNANRRKKHSDERVKQLIKLQSATHKYPPAAAEVALLSARKDKWFRRPKTAINILGGTRDRVRPRIQSAFVTNESAAAKQQRIADLTDLSKSMIIGRGKSARGSTTPIERVMREKSATYDFRQRERRLKKEHLQEYYDKHIINAPPSSPAQPNWLDMRNFNYPKVVTHRPDLESQNCLTIVRSSSAHDAHNNHQNWTDANKRSFSSLSQLPRKTFSTSQPASMVDIYDLHDNMKPTSKTISQQEETDVPTQPSLTIRLPSINDNIYSDKDETDTNKGENDSKVKFLLCHKEKSKGNSDNESNSDDDDINGDRRSVKDQSNTSDSSRDNITKSFSTVTSVFCVRGTQYSNCSHHEDHFQCDSDIIDHVRESQDDTEYKRKQPLFYSYSITKDGYKSTKDGYNGTKDGYNSIKDGYNGTKDGYNGTKDGYNGTNDGYNSIRDGYNSLKDGYNSTKDGHNSIKNGYNSTKDSYNSTKDGYNSTKNGNNSTKEI